MRSMVVQRSGLVAAALVVLATMPATGGTKKASPPAPAPPALDAKAVDVLTAASARLAAARTMRFTAVTTYESPSRLGPPLAYTTTSDVTFQRPDKLRVVTPGDGPAVEFYYDGRTMTAYSPAENVAAVAEAPPTIEAALATAYTQAAIYFPFTDVLVADPWADMRPEITRAFYIGQSRVVGGTTTDLVAVAGPKVFAQLWIGAEDKLPRRIRAVYRDDRSRLRHDVELSNWRVGEAVPADAFEATAAKSAQSVGFARPDPPPAPEKARAPKASPKR